MGVLLNVTMLVKDTSSLKLRLSPLIKSS